MKFVTKKKKNLFVGQYLLSVLSHLLFRCQNSFRNRTIIKTILTLYKILGISEGKPASLFTIKPRAFGENCFNVNADSFSANNS